MPLSPSHNQLVPAMSDATQAESRSASAERAIAIAFAAAVSAAMIGWLYMLAVALWDGANWLMS
jgi:hypothetical protein